MGLKRKKNMEWKHFPELSDARNTRKSKGKVMDLVIKNNNFRLGLNDKPGEPDMGDVAAESAYGGIRYGGR